MNAALDLVIIGCGSRGLGYAQLAVGRRDGRYRVVAGADPRGERVARVQALADGGFRAFASAAECLAAGRLGDVAVVATGDADHVAPCLGALALGYHVLLEKPVAPTPAEVLAVRDAACRHGRAVVVCHVLRHAPLWAAVAQALAAGRIGRIVHLDHREGVGAWHQAHSYVRGHWARTADATPMILAKCCHDLDLIRWYLGRPPRAVASFGALSWFHAGNRPAGAAARCAECGVRAACAYDCARYAGDQRGWLWTLEPGLARAGDAAAIRAWVEASPWGRCAWACDNDAVDHQVVSMDFGDATAALTMTAFADGRSMTICGSEGTLHASDEHGLRVVGHHGGSETIALPADVGGHGGGDAALIAALADELRGDGPGPRTGIAEAVDSHLMAFAAEASRRAGGVPVPIDRVLATA